MSLKIKIKDDHILLPNRLILKAELGGVIAALQKIKDDCNVANIHPVDPKQSLFDSCEDDTVSTVEINNLVLQDFQRLRGTANEDIKKTLVALIQYYDNHDSLNLILLGDALQTRQSYIRYTAQLAHYIRTNQRSYKQVKVQFDPTQTRLGIFCRKEVEPSELATDFISSIVVSMRMYGSAQVLIRDIPVSYLSNKAMVKHILTHKLGYIPKIEWTADSIQVFSN
jgi:hypothetical protein